MPTEPDKLLSTLNEDERHALARTLIRMGYAKALDWILYLVEIRVDQDPWETRYHFAVRVPIAIEEKHTSTIRELLLRMRGSEEERRLLARCHPWQWIEGQTIDFYAFVIPEVHNYFALWEDDDPEYLHKALHEGLDPIDIKLLDRIVAYWQRAWLHEPEVMSGWSYPSSTWSRSPAKPHQALLNYLGERRQTG